MKQFLSFGAGVNSTALLLLLEDQGVEFETAFVNHGADTPETYEYLHYLKEIGFKITEIIPDHRGHSTLYGYCTERGIIPSVRFRWCTEYFKVKPYILHLEPYLPCISFIGFDADEDKRVERNKNHTIKYRIEHQIENRFPLFDQGIDRKGCIKIITEHGLDIPPRSGCYFCPFQRVGWYKALLKERPDLFRKVEILEEGTAHKGVYLKGNKPIRKIAE